MMDVRAHDSLVHDDDDRLMDEVEAVGREAEAPDRPRVEQADERARTTGGHAEERARDGRSQCEIHPLKMAWSERPPRALQRDRR
jgi:hypothetical protein